MNRPNTGILVQIIRDYIKETYPVIPTPGVHTVSSNASQTPLTPQPGQRRLPEEGMLAALENAANAAIIHYGAIQSPEERALYRGRLENLYRAVTARSLKVDDIQTARNLQVMAAQELNILTWIDRSVEGAAAMRVTTDTARMVKSPDKERRPSFLDATAVAIPQAAGEGKEGVYWRGIEAIDKMGDNISHQAIYDRSRFHSEFNKAVLYAMVHGYAKPAPVIEEARRRGDNISPIHETRFVNDFIPGSVQYTSTGPGHFQGFAVDLKYVTEGRGIQYNKIYDTEGKLIKVFAQVLKPGTWAIALPGAVDSVENLGGLRFNDISLQLSVPLGVLGWLNPWFDFNKYAIPPRTSEEVSGSAPLGGV